MRQLFADIRYALRRLRQSLGFSLTAILTLALGIGATTAIFSVVEGVLLRPLPFPEPSRLVSLDDILDGAGDAVRGVTAAGVLAYMRDARGFSALGGYGQATYELTGSGEPARIPAARLSASMFPVLGIAPVLGRPFTQAEDQGANQSPFSATACGTAAFMPTPTYSARSSCSTANRTQSWASCPAPSSSRSSLASSAARRSGCP